MCIFSTTNEEAKMHMASKACARCQREKQVSEFRLIRRPGRPLLPYSYCRDCTKAIKRAAYVRNRDRVLAQHRRYYLKNRKRCSDYKKRWWALRGPEVNARNREKYRTDPRFHAVKSSARIRWKKNNPVALAAIVGRQNRKKVAILADGYIRSLLARRGIPITAETMEAKRRTLLVRRCVKTFQIFDTLSVLCKTQSTSSTR